jgi:hypothetical protein
MTEEVRIMSLLEQENDEKGPAERLEMLGAK